MKDKPLASIVWEPIQINKHKHTFPIKDNINMLICLSGLNQDIKSNTNHKKVYTYYFTQLFLINYLHINDTTVMLS